MAILKDNRKYQAMTVAEADQLFMRMGQAKAIMDKKQAAWEKKKADLVLQMEAELAPLIEAFRELEAELSAYMSANASRFVDPRFRQVPNVGKYGYRTNPEKVEVANKGKDVVEYALQSGLADELLAMKPVPDKKKIAVAIKAGKEVVGANLIPAGDALQYSFLPGYLEQQLKG